MLDPAAAADYFDAWREVVAGRLDAIALAGRPWPAGSMAMLDGIGRTGAALGLALGPSTPYDAGPNDRLRRALDERRGPCPETVTAGMAALRDLLGPLPPPGPLRCALARRLTIAAHDLVLIACEQRALSIIAEHGLGRIV